MRNPSPQHRPQVSVIHATEMARAIFRQVRWRAGLNKGERASILFEGSSNPISYNINPFDTARVSVAAGRVAKNRLPLEVNVSLYRGDRPMLLLTLQSFFDEKGSVTSSRLSAQELQPSLRSDEEFPAYIPGKPAKKLLVVKPSGEVLKAAESLLTLTYNAICTRHHLAEAISDLTMHVEPSMRFDLLAFASAVTKKLDFKWPK